MEKIKDISTEMRNPQMWWERYHGYGADIVGSVRRILGVGKRRATEE